MGPFVKPFTKGPLFFFAPEFPFLVKLFKKEMGCLCKKKNVFLKLKKFLTNVFWKIILILTKIVKRSIIKQTQKNHAIFKLLQQNN